MTNANDVRKAHKILDDLFKGNMVLDEEREFLRSFLPEMPKQRTLEDIIEDVRQVWGATAANAWPEDTHGILEVWLWELHNQLEGLTGTTPEASQASPRLPEGMRLADHEQYGRVITSPKPNRDGIYDLLIPKPNFETGADWEYAHECELTFIDAEPAKPDHPEFLETEADYRNAPFGTIVVCSNYYPWTKAGGNWLAYGAQSRNDFEMRACRRYVLRWGDK